MRTVLVDWLHVVEVWVGANFLFGHDRAGTFSVLRTLGARYGFRAEKIDAVRYKDFVVSSTRIRRLIAEGRVDEAGALLGHHYFIDGTVVHGDARGREIGFPTANLRDRERAAAAGRASTRRPPPIGGIEHPSVTNIGTRPTFGGGGGVHVETHLLDGSRDLYDATLRLSFVQRLRDERAFPDVDALRAQIEADCRAARRLFGRISLIESSDAHSSPRRVGSAADDSRGSTPYRAASAGELAGKFAEYAGAGRRTRPQALAQARRGVARPVAEASPRASVELEMRGAGARAGRRPSNSGATRKLTCPLPD